MSDRVVEETGARRDDRTGKGRYDLISPIFMRELALCMEKGADPEKGYGERNWEKGMYLSWFYDSCLRHLYQWKETGDPVHLRNAAFNIMGLIHTRHQISVEGMLPAFLYDVPHDAVTVMEESIPDLSDDELMRVALEMGMLTEETNEDEQQQRTIEEFAKQDPGSYWTCDEPGCGTTTHVSFSKCLQCGTPRPRPLEATGRDSVHRA